MTSQSLDRKSGRLRGERQLDETFHYGKIPPQAKDLEQSVLGAIMINRDVYDLVAEILKPECFYVEAHIKIFESMVSLVRKNMPVDLLTVVEELRSQETLDLVGGPYYVTELTNKTDSFNYVAHAKIVFEKFLLREIIKISYELSAEAYSDSTDAFELLDYAESTINSIGIKNVNTGMISMERVLIDAVKKVEQWRHNDDSITGIPSGFNDLDRATRGWQPGDLIIIAARTSIGKTAFALNLVKTAAANYKRPVSVAMWSLEMKAIFLALRMMSAESKTILYKIQTGRLSDEEMQNLVNGAVKYLSKLKIFFDQNSNITIQSLTRKARRLKKTDDLGLIVVDYLQLMKGDKKRGREQEVSDISRDLKNLAVELDIPIIALSQLNRLDGVKGVTWEYGPPVNSIRESGAIEQDADVIMMLWGPTDEEIAKDPTLSGRRKVRIAKQRNGVLLTEELDFNNEIQLFSAIDKTIPASYKSVNQANHDQRITDDTETLPF